MKIALSILWVTGTIFTAKSGRSKTVLIRQGQACTLHKYIHFDYQTAYYSRDMFYTIEKCSKNII